MRQSITHCSLMHGTEVGKLPYEKRRGCYLSRLGVQIEDFGLILDVPEGKPIFLPMNGIAWGMRMLMN